ncbi:cytochrome P450 [Xylaria sp. FL0064]|nr:cytochrome P450 [Xylaria sp. FL0064]
MENFELMSNLTETGGGQDFAQGPSPLELSHTSRAFVWMYLLMAPTSAGVVWMVWNYIVKLYLVRRFYEKQGIRFVKNSYPIFGPEIRVNGLVGNNKTHDWLYTERPTDLYGSIRGFSVQLYTTDAESTEELISKTGNYVDRDTPAKYSFGRMSPYALTFYHLNDGRFKERKAMLTQGMKDSRRLYEILDRQAHLALKRLSVKHGSGSKINIRELMDTWTRESNGEFIWGRSNISRNIEVYDINGQLKSLPFMEAMNETFTDLRFNAFRFWHRVCFPLAAMPLTKESRRLGYNTKIIRKAVEDMMTTPEPKTVASNVQKSHENLGIPKYNTRDDIMTATIAGLDTIKSAVMEALYHLLSPDKEGWKRQIIDEINGVKARNGDMFTELSQLPILNAFLLETLRYEPPGSLFNNRAFKDFELSVHGRKYKIKSGTRIVTSIHGLHQNEENWKKRVGSDMAPLSEFDPNRFLQNSNSINSSGCFLPFGKGPRRCPGQGAGLMMTKVFLVTFLTYSNSWRLVMPEDLSKDASWFNLYSRAGFDIACDEEVENEN